VYTWGGSAAAAVPLISKLWGGSAAAAYCDLQLQDVKLQPLYSADLCLFRKKKIQILQISIRTFFNHVIFGLFFRVFEN
jgi:hypothetical protein